MSLTPERKLKKVVIDLMRSPLFADMSGIFMLGTKSIDDDMPTAATNGRDEVYGRKFVEGLDLKELAFVVVHESYHKMLRQLTTWIKLFEEDAGLANKATDYVVNLAIVNRDPQGTIVKMPEKDGKPMGLLDRRFAGMHTKQVFDILKQEQQGGDGRGPKGDGAGFDEHDWEGAKQLTQEEKEQLVKDVDQAIRQGQITAQKLHGKGGGNLDRELMDLLDPKVDWRELLREFVTAVCNGRDFSSWRKPNRRFLSEDVIMPSLVSERVGHMVVGIDTSGSIGGPELARFLTEVKEIAERVNPDKVDLIYWDARVAAHEVYNSGTLGDLINSTRPVGGGGTSVRCVSDYLSKEGIKPECAIILTDGYLGDDWGDWDVPILWAICGGNKVIAPVGKTVHIEE
jgi:predicted metal-dependent peptidase